MPKQGLTVERKQTKHFIEQNPTELVLKRASWVDDGAGGQKVGQRTEVPPQTVRLIPQAMPTESRTSDGEVVNLAYIIVAEHDADIRETDAFVLNGRRYEVTWVYAVNGYEIKAEVVHRG